jgi:hypothetical protein
MPDQALKFTIGAAARRDVFADRLVAVTATALLLLPALWNGFPLLEYDTGGYLARWYEGYLVPSRPAPYGLLLNAGSLLDFWPVALLQSALTVWVVTLTMRLHGLGERPLARLAIFIVLAVATTLPFIASVLLTDIFVGLAVLALHLLIAKPGSLSRRQRGGLILLIGFSAAAHSATLLLMIALGVTVMLLSLLLPRLVERAAVPRITLSLIVGLAILLSANFVVTKRIAWTPGGYGIIFGRLLQDGIVNKFLDEHCPTPRLRLCAHRHELPRDADLFLWGSDLFNSLGRFDGLGEEMRTIVLESFAAYPWLQIKAAAVAAARQVVTVRSGEGVLDSIWHTYGMIEDYTPWNVPAMRAARQQHGELSFDAINRLHEPVALVAMLLLLLPVGGALRRRVPTDIERLAALVTLAILANAAILGPLSNPHDRYGARIVWLAVLVVALWMTERRSRKT